jgi:hypothetical protein
MSPPRTCGLWRKGTNHCPPTWVPMIAERGAYNPFRWAYCFQSWTIPHSPVQLAGIWLHPSRRNWMKSPALPDGAEVPWLPAQPVHFSIQKERKNGCRLDKPEPSLWEIITHLTTSEKPSTKLKLITFIEKSFSPNSLSYSSHTCPVGKAAYVFLLGFPLNHLTEPT